MQGIEVTYKISKYSMFERKKKLRVDDFYEWLSQNKDFVVIKKRYFELTDEDTFWYNKRKSKG